MQEPEEKSLGSFVLEDSLLNYHIPNFCYRIKVIWFLLNRIISDLMV